MEPSFTPVTGSWTFSLIRFYTECLGLEHVRALPIRDEATNHFFGYPGDREPCSSSRTTTTARSRTRSARARPHRNRGLHLDETLAALDQKGVQPERAPYLVGTTRICFVRDPDGYRIELTSSRRTGFESPVWLGGSKRAGADPCSRIRLNPFESQDPFSYVSSQSSERHATFETSSSSFSALRAKGVARVSPGRMATPGRLAHIYVQVRADVNRTGWGGCGSRFRSAMAVGAGSTRRRKWPV